MNNDTKKLRALLICFWIMIIATWLVCIISSSKLNIVVHNERLIALGNFIDNCIVLRLLWAFLLYYFNMIFIVFTFLRKKLFSYKPIIISISILFVWVIKYIFREYNFTNYIDFCYILLPLFLDYKNKKLYINCIFELAKAFIFSLICAFIKNYNGIENENLPSLVASIIMIDYYIFFVANYLYTRKVLLALFQQLISQLLRLIKERLDIL